MYPDFKDLLSALNARQVKYLIVGGYAVSFHAQPRATKDLDILIRADPENGKALHAALEEFGASLQGVSAGDLTEPGSFFRMGSPPVMVDILPSIRGVEFDQAWSRHVEVAVDDTLTVPIISREDLLASKLAAGRPQDLADAAALEELQSQHESRPGQPDQPAPEARQSFDELQQRSAERWWARANRAGQSGIGSENDQQDGFGHEHSPDDDLLP